MELTVKEASEQGYSHYGYEGREYQTLRDLKYITPDDFDENIRLFDQQPGYVPSISAEQIAELIAEQVQCEVDDNTADDTDEAYNIVNALDFEPVSKMVNEALKGKRYYFLTKIKLVP